VALLPFAPTYGSRPEKLDDGEPPRPPRPV
jgi:hypothetical protein